MKLSTTNSSNSYRKLPTNYFLFIRNNYYKLIYNNNNNNKYVEVISVSESRISVMKKFTFYTFCVSICKVIFLVIYHQYGGILQTHKSQNAEIQLGNAE